jgi:excisionase family DNA binding protein
MELLTVKETADLLRVSTVTVRRYIASGKLAAVRVGRNIRIRQEDVMGVVEPRFAGESAEWRPENHPLMQSIGFIKDDGPIDDSLNHDKYLAEAYEDTHKDAEVNHGKQVAETTAHYSLSGEPLSGIEDDTQGDIDEDPAKYVREAYAEEWQAKLPARSKFADKSDEWLLENHPLIKLIGLVKDDGPTDMVRNHDKYLADAYSDTHEE